MDCSLPGSSVHGIFQARVLEWVAISFSRGIFSTRGGGDGDKRGNQQRELGLDGQGFWLIAGLSVGPRSSRWWGDRTDLEREAVRWDVCTCDGGGCWRRRPPDPSFGALPHSRGFPGGPDGKESVCNAEEGWIPGSGRPPGEGNDNPLQYSCLENSLDRGAWQAIVHGVAKSWTPLSD